MIHQMAVASATDDGTSLLSQPWLPCTQAHSISQYLTEQRFGPIFRSLLVKWTQLGSPYLQALGDLGKRAQCPLLDLEQLCLQQEKSMERSIFHTNGLMDPANALKSYRVFVSHMAMFCAIETELDCLERGVEMSENFLFYHSSLSKHLMAFKDARSRCEGEPQHLCVGELIWGQAIHASMQTLWSEIISIAHDMDAFSADHIDPIVSSRTGSVADNSLGLTLPSTQPASLAVPVQIRTNAQCSAASLGEEDSEAFSTPLASPFSLYKSLDADDEDSDYDGKEGDTLRSQDETDDTLAADYTLPIIELRRRPAIAQSQDHKVAMLMAVIGSARNDSHGEEEVCQGSEEMQLRDGYSATDDNSVKKWCRTLDTTMEQGSSGHSSNHASSLQSHGDDPDRFSMTSDDDSMKRLANAHDSIHGCLPIDKARDILSLGDKPVVENLSDVSPSMLGVVLFAEGLKEKRMDTGILAEHSIMQSANEALQQRLSYATTSRPRGWSINSTSSSVVSSNSDCRVKGRHKELRRIQSHEQYERSRDQRGALRSSIIELEHVVEDVRNYGLDSSSFGKRLCNVFLAAQTEFKDKDADEDIGFIRVLSQVGANERKRKSKRKLRYEDERNVAIVSEVASVTLGILNQTYEGTFWPANEANLSQLHDRLANFWWKQQHRIDHMIQAERRMLVRGKIGASAVGAIAELKLRFRAMAACEYRARVLS